MAHEFGQGRAKIKSALNACPLFCRLNQTASARKGARAFIFGAAKGHRFNIKRRATHRKPVARRARLRHHRYRHWLFSGIAGICKHLQNRKWRGHQMQGGMWRKTRIRLLFGRKGLQGGKGKQRIIGGVIGFQPVEFKPRQITQMRVAGKRGKTVDKISKALAILAQYGRVRQVCARKCAGQDAKILPAQNSSNGRICRCQTVNQADDNIIAIDIEALARITPARRHNRRGGRQDGAEQRIKKACLQRHLLARFARQGLCRLVNLRRCQPGQDRIGALRICK